MSEHKPADLPVVKDEGAITDNELGDVLGGAKAAGSSGSGGPKSLGALLAIVGTVLVRAQEKTIDD